MAVGTRSGHARVHGLQRAQLQHEQEQADDAGQARVLQVLLPLPQAYGAQGNEVSSVTQLASHSGTRPGSV